MYFHDACEVYHVQVCHVNARSDPGSAKKSGGHRKLLEPLSPD